MSNFTRPTLPTRVSAFCRRLLPMILLAPVAVLLGAWSFQDGEEKVTIKGQDVPLLTVFKSIKKQTGYNFFYAANFVNDKEKVSVDMRNARVDDVLRKVLGHDYTWVYNENAVSITKKKGEVKRSEAPAVPVKDSSVNQITVSGSVTDAKGTPIPGATVMVKGTHDGASTDEDGHFSLAGVRPDAVLVISSVGFERREIPVKGKTILAKLNVSVNDLDEVVAVAYGEATQRANTGAMTVVRGQQIQDLPSRSFDKSLQGLVPGLLVTSGTGQPGGGISNFVLRGIATAADPIDGSTVRNPLIVIDGMPVSQEHAQLYINTRTTAISNPLAQLNPSDIETISVLKDAAAIALYGAKASNGVILITTKKGKPGKTRFNFRHQTDFASAINGRQEVLNQQEYLDLLYETYRNTDPQKWTEEAIRSDLFKKFPYRLSGADTSFYPDPDWRRELYNDWATTVSNEISMSGGNAQSNFYLNLEYTKQNGVVRKTGYDRKSLRFNFENRPVDWFKLGFNTALSYNIQDYGGVLNGGGNLDAADIGLMSPLNPVRLDDGNYVLNFAQGAFFPNQVNPAAAAAYNMSRNTAFRGLGKVYAEINILKYFRLSSNLGVDFMLSEAKEKVDPRLTNPGAGTIGGKIDEQDTRRSNLITTNILRYDQVFKSKHAVGVVLGQEAQILQQKILGVGVTGLGLPYYDQISSPGATVFRQSGYVLKETLLSYFGQVNYGFNNRYFLSGSVRTDGSSRFGADKRFGTYWSTGLGWVVTEEPFMRSTGSWLSYLKIRGSLGVAGNAGAIDRFTPYDKLDPAKYLGGTAVYAGASQAGNADVKWEETFTWDAGMEARFLGERLSVTADVYQRNTSNLIYNVNLPLSSGFSTILANIGEMRNKGVEIALSADLIRIREFRWNLSANWSTNKNVLVKASTPLAATVTGEVANKEGESFNSFYTAVWAGVNPADGTGQWLDSAGKVTSNYAAAKREFVGKPQPDGFGSVINTFTFKGIELSAMLYYQYGYQIYNLSGFVNDGVQPYRNQGKEALDRWKKPGDIATNPKRTLSNPYGGNAYPSTRWLFQGDHIRLQYVSVAFNFPGYIANRLHINSLRTYIQGNNLALWNKYPNRDPSTVNVSGQSVTSYPIQRSFSVGLNIGF